jgi:HD-GYP domain-containing protein (c-di-GMP phosphodiesterase class II)
VLLLGGSVRGSRPDLDLDFLSTLLNQAAIAMDNARMLQHTHEQNIGVIRTLVSLIEQRHQAGSSVTERVSSLVAEVAREMSFPSEKMRDLVYGTVLRDIGMIPISDLVLRSPRKLTENEWKQIKGHPETGVELLGPLQLPPTVQEVVLCHHERFNGEGYPRGQQGRAIPLSARIVAVVESYVAMVSELPYRTALSEVEAISILNENWGMRYDPDIVEAFLRVLAREESFTRRVSLPVDEGRPVEATV